MSQGETLISLLLILVVYFLYQIAKQLTYVTGKRMRLPQFTRTISHRLKKSFANKHVHKDSSEEDLPTKLPN